MATITSSKGLANVGVVAKHLQNTRHEMEQRKLELMGPKWNRDEATTTIKTKKPRKFTGLKEEHTTEPAGPDPGLQHTPVSPVLGPALQLQHTPRGPGQGLQQHTPMAPAPGPTPALHLQVTPRCPGQGQQQQQQHTPVAPAPRPAPALQLQVAPRCPGKGQQQQQQHTLVAPAHVLQLQFTPRSSGQGQRLQQLHLESPGPAPGPAPALQLHQLLQQKLLQPCPAVPPTLQQQQHLESGRSHLSVEEVASMGQGQVEKRAKTALALHAQDKSDIMNNDALVSFLHHMQVLELPVTNTVFKAVYSAVNGQGFVCSVSRMER
ncbi:hypothetical protein QJQ45_003678 [Haematococcus lacustris]|nr:hypothetical protein QJQ45_003678 [Haematococcus lacustris]